MVFAIRNFDGMEKFDIFAFRKKIIMTKHETKRSY